MGILKIKSLYFDDRSSVKRCSRIGSKRNRRKGFLRLRSRKGEINYICFRKMMSTWQDGTGVKLGEEQISQLIKSQIINFLVCFLVFAFAKTYFLGLSFSNTDNLILGKISSLSLVTRLLVQTNRLNFFPFYFLFLFSFPFFFFVFFYLLTHRKFKNKQSIKL